MDFFLSEEQEMLRTAARGFLDKECPKTLVRQIEKDAKGYSPELWGKMADLGWMGLIFPEEYGGMGLSILDLIILMEEMGRALVPGPFLPTVVLGGFPLLVAGTNEQKQKFLPKITQGEICFTMALTEPAFSYDPKDIAVSASLQEGMYVLNGTKLFVPNADIADWILCVARTNLPEEKDECLTIFPVEAKNKGVTIIPLNTFAPERQCEVHFENVGVAAENTIGDPGKGWEIIERTLQLASVAQSALMLGEMQQAMEMTIDYAKERIQFDRPIGSFQTIQHKCADIATYIESARFLTYQAAWRLSNDLPCSEEISIAKAFSMQACNEVYPQAHQIHGAIAFTLDHDLGLYSRRSKNLEAFFGDSAYHHEIIAQHMGL